MKFMTNLLRAEISPSTLLTGILSWRESPTKRIIDGMSKLPPPMPPALQRIAIMNTQKIPNISDIVGGKTSCLNVRVYEARLRKSLASTVLFDTSYIIKF